jgi:ribosomal protein S18 acetylase RimI-like enzyme
MTGMLTTLPAAAAAPLAHLHGDCFPEDPWDEPTLQRLLALFGVFGYLAWRDDVPVGFVLARDLGDDVEILSLGVLPGGRRRGAGRALLDAIIAEAGRRRRGSVVLEVAAANAAARRLYAGAGFVQVGRRPHYYRDTRESGDALILRATAAQ